MATYASSEHVVCHFPKVIKMLTLHAFPHFNLQGQEE